MYSSKNNSFKMFSDSNVYDTLKPDELIPTK